MVEAPPLAIFAVVVTVGEAQGTFGVAQVVEVYAVHIVALHNLFDEAHEVFLGLRVAGVQEVFVLVAQADVGLAAGDGLIAQRGHMLASAQGDGHHPGMALHAALVALLDGKGQRVVAGVLSHLARQDGVEGFDVRAVEDVAPRARLEEDGVEVGRLQLVQYLDQLFLLLADTGGRGGFGTRPVEAVDGGNPRGPHLVLGRSLGGEGEKRCQQADYGEQKRTNHK